MSLINRLCACQEGCIFSSTQVVFSVYGESTSYFMANPGHKIISKHVVDKCLLVALNDEQKCDYLFVVNNDGVDDGYFIELKGSDVTKAIKQLISSVAQLGDEINGEIYGRIVCSKFLKAPFIKASQPYLRLMKIIGGNLIIRSQHLTETV